MVGLPLRSAKCPKLKLARQTKSINETPVSLSNVEEDSENVEALKKLIISRNPPAQTVQELLTATRTYRNQWLKKPEISIHDILHKFPALKEPKWVSFYVHHTCCQSLTNCIHTSQLLYEFNDMFNQTISEVVVTNWRMVCHKLLQVPEDGLVFHEEYHALQLITKNIYHKKPEKLPFTFAEVSFSY